jgi:hypothetical protein
MLGILEYTSGLNSASAVILNQNPFFEMACNKRWRKAANAIGVYAVGFPADSAIGSRMLNRAPSATLVAVRSPPMSFSMMFLDM